jgi:iron complex outermembrane receptor protein
MRVACRKGRKINQPGEEAMKTLSRLGRISLIGLAGAAAALPAAAWADVDDRDAPARPDEASSREGEIVVTAQRREEKSVDVPITIASLGADQLATANVNALSDTAKLTPGLRFDTQGPAMQPTIRGVGTAITTSGGGPNVAIYVDGYFQPNTYTSDLQLMRLESIQVLKGPQGTLFGRNTTGGAILVTSADPSTEPSAEFRTTYGRFNALTLQGYGTFGVGDNIAFDIEGLYRRGDGYFTDVLANDDQIGGYENWSVRVGLKLWLSDNITALLRYIHTETDDPTTQLVNSYVDKSGDAGFLNQVSPAGRALYGLTTSQGKALSFFFAPPGTFATAPGEIALSSPAGFRSKIDTVQLTLKADLGFADLTSYSQYRHDSSPWFADLDATALPIFGINVPVVDKTWSQEILLTSKPGSRLQWTAGANFFYFRDTWMTRASFGGAPFAPLGGSSTTTKSYAAFLDATYEVAEDFFVTAGARYSHDIVTDAYFRATPFTRSYIGPNGETIPFNGAPGTIIPVGDLKNDSITPRLVLRYKPSEETSIYASYTRGYKAGILNVGGASQQPIRPEKINAFEAGFKYDGGRLSFDFAGFCYDYKNLQVSSYQSGQAQIRNAASSEIYGLEAQFRYRVSDSFSVYGGASWTHARYKSFPNAPFYSYCDPVAPATPALACVPPALGGAGPGGIVQSSIDASGFHMQRSPEFTGNLGASYDLEVADGELTLSGNLYYTSSFYFDPEQQFRQNAHALLSLRAQWVDPSERFTIAVFGDNVTDKRYLSQVLFTTVGIGSVWSSPATYGVSVGAKF